MSVDRTYRLGKYLGSCTFTALAFHKQESHKAGKRGVGNTSDEEHEKKR